MEYMKNGSLFNILITSGKFEESMSRTIAINLYNAIYQLHYMGITHFDLKPDNIMFNEKMTLKLCDLGYANNPIGFT
jgi:serine/threonine protein kinase